MPRKGQAGNFMHAGDRARSLTHWLRATDEVTTTRPRFVEALNPPAALVVWVSFSRSLNEGSFKRVPEQERTPRVTGHGTGTLGSYTFLPRALGLYEASKFWPVATGAAGASGPPWLVHGAAGTGQFTTRFIIVSRAVSPSSLRL